MIAGLLSEVSARLDGHDGWVARARVIHLGSKWEGRGAFVPFAPGEVVPGWWSRSNPSDHASPMWVQVARRYTRRWAQLGFPGGAATGR